MRRRGDTIELRQFNPPQAIKLRAADVKQLHRDRRLRRRFRLGRGRPMTAVTLRRKARAMAAPKASWIGNQARNYIDRVVCEFGLGMLPHLWQSLAPPERRAMAEIAATADLLVVDERT